MFEIIVHNKKRKQCSVQFELDNTEYSHPNSVIIIFTSLFVGDNLKLSNATFFLHVSGFKMFQIKLKYFKKCSKFLLVVEKAWPLLC